MSYINLENVLDFSVECYPNAKYSITLLVSSRLTEPEKMYVHAIFKNTFGSRFFIIEKLIEEAEISKGKAGFLP